MAEKLKSPFELPEAPEEEEVILPPPADLPFEDEVLASPQDLPEAEMTEEDKRAFIPEISEDELKSIAKKHGMKEEEWEDLADWVPYFWANVEGKKSGLGEDVLGALNEIVLGSMGTKAASLFTDDKKYNALADIKGLLERRESLSRMGTEIIGGLIPALGLAKGAATIAPKLGRAGKALEAYVRPTSISGGAAAGALTGAAGGVSVAASEDEVASALLGGAIGAFAGGLAGGIGRSILKGEEAATAAKKLQEELGTEVQQLTQRTNQILQEEAPRIAASNQRAAEVADVIASSQEKTIAKLPENTSKTILKQINKLKTKDFIDGTYADKLKGLSPDELKSVNSYLKAVEDESNMRELALWIKKRELFGDSTDSKVLHKTGKAAKIVSNWKKNTPLPDQEALLAGFNKAKAAKLAIQDLGLSKLSDRSASLVSQMTKVIDGKWAFRIFDDVLGTDSEVLQDVLVANRRQFTENSSAFSILKDKQLRPFTSKLLPDEEAAKDFFTKYEKGGVSAFSGPMKDMAKRWENFMKLAEKRAKDMGLDFKARTNYVPHMTVDLPTAIGRIDAKLKLIGSLDLNDAGAIKRLMDSGDKDFKDLIEGLSYLTGKTIVKEGAKPQEVVKRLSAAMNTFADKQELRNKIASKSGFLLERKGAVPEFLREYNPLQLADAWTNSVFRHAAHREPLEMLNTYKSIAINRGVPEAANYYERLIGDLSGRRAGTLAEGIDSLLDSIESKFISRAERAKAAGNSIRASIFDGMATLPRVLPAMTQAIYPGVLGLSPRAILVNATQIPTMLIPEVGGAYGTKLYLKALGRAFGLKTSGSSLKKGSASAATSLERLRGRAGAKGTVDLGAEDIFNSLKQAGSQSKPGTLFGRMDDVLEGENMQARRYYNDVKDNVFRTPKSLGKFMDTSKEGLERLSNGMMYFFEMSEKMNRVTSISFARDVADDLMKGSSDALKILKSPRMGSGYKEAIRSAMEKKDSDEVFRLVKEYFQSNAVLNYDRASLSEAARYLGPVFSTFTKWPLSISGDIYQQILRTADVPTRKIITANMNKYVLPFMGLMMFDRVARTAITEYTNEEVANNILGRDSLLGIASSAPIMSPAAIATGENLFTPPILSNTAGVVSAAFSMKPTRILNATDRLAQTVIPPYALMGLATKTVPSMLENERIPTIAEGLYGTISEGSFESRDISRGAKRARRKLERWDRKTEKQFKELQRTIDRLFK